MLTRWRKNVKYALTCYVEESALLTYANRKLSREADLRGVGSAQTPQIRLLSSIWEEFTRIHDTTETEEP
jgi:hypothetical protein